MIQPIVLRAAAFAREQHAGQVRKYTGDPYFVHLEEVAQLVTNAGMGEDVRAAAYLHDVVEDTETTVQDVTLKFGDYIGYLVWSLTDQSKPHHGNRATRKSIDRMHLAQGNADVHTIKVADLISNTRSIVEHDPHFSKVYLQEKELLLKVLTRSEPELLAYAHKLLWEAQERRRH